VQWLLSCLHKIEGSPRREAVTDLLDEHFEVVVMAVSPDKLENLALKMRTVPGLRGFETYVAPDIRQIGGALFLAL
jgi:hypothetical protein